MEVKKQVEHPATCRSCLNNCAVGQEVYGLFDDLHDGMTFWDIIFDLFGYECNVELEWPDLICLDCADTIEKFYNFKSNFLDNQQRLHASFEEQEESVDGEYEYLNEHDQKTSHQSLVKEREENDQKNKQNSTQGDQKLNETDALITSSNEIKEEESQVLTEIQQTSGNLPNHVLQQGDRWLCKICKQEFTELSDVCAHVDSHKKFICEHCGLKFLKNYYLNEHLQKHSKDKSYVCNICGKAYNRRTVLWQHKRIHTNPRNYKCQQCGNSFNSRSVLKTHVYLKHVGERKFECHICHLKFPLKSTLEKHVYRHQVREKNYICDICDMSYMNKDTLNRHVRAKHNRTLK